MFYVGRSEANFLSEANILVSKASKLYAGARIFRGPQGPEILVRENFQSTKDYLNLVTIQEWYVDVKVARS